MKKTFLGLLLTAANFGAIAQPTIVKYLSGTDKDHTVAWDFYCTGGRNSGKWTKIPVPSNWELQGFGEYNYGHDKSKSNEQGIYRHNFISGNWKGKRIFIVFEGSMTDTKVMLNGSQAGPVHQGSFYRFKYDITDLVKPKGTNLLEVTVDKTSANESVNDAERRNSDFWVFGGIFRPVYLEIVPETFIDRLAIDAKADGSFAMNVYPQHLQGGETIEAQVQTPGGISIGRVFTAAADSGRLNARFVYPLLWNAESPHLYQVLVSLKRKGQVIHQIRQRFGFRTVEFRQHDGIYVNGAKIILKGCDRHSFWPETGRTLSRDVHLTDVKLMKEMNMNAVRMSHYPPDQAFLDICDSLGLYVLDELTGWQAKYDTIVGRRLVKELVIRDVNHPSVVAWDNGNEGGWNRALDQDYALYDPQDRIVLHPWEKFNGTDTKHYPDYNYVSKVVATGQDIFFPTEFMHGLYDGGAGAALDDFWSLMMQYPHAGGGFIWALLDEAVIRTDKNNSYDADGNHGPDGIVGPHREKEASFYTIKEIWSPVQILLDAIEPGFTGQIPVGNRYAFTNLSQCTFKWQLVKFPGPRLSDPNPIVTSGGILKTVDIKPSEKGLLNIPLPGSWRNNDALYLTAYGPDKKRSLPGAGRPRVNPPGSPQQQPSGPRQQQKARSQPEKTHPHYGSNAITSYTISVKPPAIYKRL
ncbi:glycoside hydrolase family 2 TIM barrel-domain containing protein [Puia sp. P3]|uniref:glycoside hydrolase family 2 protein n=1 Tax=Puia sp. P3 TaxID=3423952 RepID=UPI003D67C82D